MTPLGVGLSMMLAPRARKGACGDQKGPRIAEEVGVMPFSAATLWAISSTRLCGGSWGG